MKKGQFTDEQTVAVLQQAQRGEKTILALCRENNIFENTFYRWRSRFGNATPADVAKTRELEKQNTRLKRLLAERDLENDILN